MPLHEGVIPVRSFIRKTQAKALFFGGCACALFCVLWTWREGLGFLGGAVLSAVNFRLMFADAMGMAGKGTRKASRFVAGRCVLRYAIMGGYLAIVATKTPFNVYTAFAGLLSVQAVLFGEAVFSFIVLPGRRRE